MQDHHGRAPLHQSIIRWCAEISDPEFFDSPDLYKEIAKELLFNGADRQLKTKNGLRAIDILEEHKASDENGIDHDEENEEKYYKIRGILLG